MDLSGERYEQETMIEENREKGRDQMEKEKNNEKREEGEEKEINDEKKNEREEEEDERPSSPRPSSPQGRQGIHQEEPSPRGKGPSREDLAPPDGGWGWMVTLGAFVIMVSHPGESQHVCANESL